MRQRDTDRERERKRLVLEVCQAINYNFKPCFDWSVWGVFSVKYRERVLKGPQIQYNFEDKVSNASQKLGNMEVENRILEFLM